METEQRYKKKFANILIAQLTLILIGLLAFIYISTEVSKKYAEYNRLKDDIEKLSSVVVTPDNEVYEVKASAKSTNNVDRQGRPQYFFAVYINSSEEVLQKIEKVTYYFNHPSFIQPNRESTDPNTKFAFSYIGWGCISDVDVTIVLKNGFTQNIKFDMCRSIGLNWIDNESIPPPEEKPVQN